MSSPPPTSRFDDLADLLRGFVRRPRVRGFTIEVGPADLPEASRLVAGFEHHADNRAPFFPVRPTDCTCAGSAWAEALRQVQETHAALHTAGAPVGLLPAPPVGEDPAASFSVVLAGIASGVEAPALGVLIALQLGGDVDPVMLDALATMVRSPQLSEVRFIVIGQPRAKLEGWATQLGDDRMWFHRVEPASNALAAQTLETLDAETRHGRGFRGAWPTGIRPPPRPRRHASTRTALGPAGTEVESAGHAATLDAEELAEFEHQLGVRIRRAEAHMRQGQGPDALREQTGARELCTERGQHERAIDMEMMLGGYLLRLDQPRLAADSFRRADDSGFEHQAYERAARAQLNQGIANERADDPVAALKAYRRTIETGKGVANCPSVVFEAYRRAGEVALREGLDVECIGLWGDAVAYARDLDPSERGDGVKEIATRLSALLIQHRRYSQAREIDRIAEAL